MSQQTQRAPIFNCPDEILLIILQYLNPGDTHRFRLSSSRCYSVASENSLWKHYCRLFFSHWDSKHETTDSILKWKDIFAYRTRVNLRLERLFDDIIAMQTNKGWRIYQICLYGNDAKDFLVGECRTPEDSQKALSRRWYGRYILGVLNRVQALNEFATAGDGATVEDQPSFRYKNRRLERLLGSIDMFFAWEDKVSLDSISAKLDDMARSFLQCYPSCIWTNTIQERALLLLRWLNSQLDTRHNVGSNVHGVPAMHPIGRLLFGHQLLYGFQEIHPIIAAAIFVALAQRLDVHACFCLHPLSVVVGSGACWDADDQHQAKSILHDENNKLLNIRPGVCNNPQEITSKVTPITDQTFVIDLLKSFPESVELSRASFSPMVLHAQDCPPKIKSYYDAQAVYASTRGLALLVSPSALPTYVTRFNTTSCENDDDLLAMERCMKLRIESGHVDDAIYESALGHIDKLVAKDEAGTARWPRANPRGLKWLGQVMLVSNSECRFVGAIVESRMSWHTLLLPASSFKQAWAFCETLGLPFRPHHDRGNLLITVSNASCSRIMCPSRVPADIFHSAGAYFESFDDANCLFVPCSTMVSDSNSG